MIGILCFAVFLVLSLFRISSFAFYTYDSVNKIPYNEVGLILGTSSHTSDGNKNPFFINRIRAASLLYKKGKISYILVSGDNRHASYNEPREMIKALIKEGVPKEVIVADFAGFSTIDSIVRASKVFMLDKVTVISQSFHNERALYIANNEGIEAIGFNASDPPSKWAHFIVYFREFFARIKCIFDINFLNTQPTFLGKPVQIGDRPLPKQTSNKPKKNTSAPKQISLSANALKGKKSKIVVEYKQPTDAAVILNQQNKAKEQFKQIIKQENIL